LQYNAKDKAYEYLVVNNGKERKETRGAGTEVNEDAATPLAKDNQRDRF
jgi:hypothetical protein